MTLLEAAALLGVQPATLRQQIANGRLKARKVGRDWSVSRREVERYRRESSRRSRDAAEARTLHDALDKAALWILQLGVPPGYETWRPEYEALLDTMDRALTRH